MHPEDYIAIYQLLARYNHVFDSGDYEGWSKCFTEDGKFQGRAGAFVGRQALAAYAKEAIARGTYRHLTGNIYIEPSPGGAEAVVSSHMIYYTVDDRGPKIELSARQVDRIVKRDGGWLIRERLLTVDAAGRFG